MILTCYIEMLFFTWHICHLLSELPYSDAVSDVVYSDLFVSDVECMLSLSNPDNLRLVLGLRGL